MREYGFSLTHILPFNTFATMGVFNDPLCKMRSRDSFFENFTAIFGMCSLEVPLLTQKLFLIYSESFSYHKIFLKHLKNLLKNKMASGVHKYSAYEAAAFILASDSESNDAFDDESTLESSISYDSEEEPCFPGMEVDEKQKKEQQVCFKNYFSFGTCKSFDVSSLF